MYSAEVDNLDRGHSTEGRSKSTRAILNGDEIKSVWVRHGVSVHRQRSKKNIREKTVSRRIC